MRARAAALPTNVSELPQRQRRWNIGRKNLSSCTKLGIVDAGDAQSETPIKLDPAGSRTSFLRWWNNDFGYSVRMGTLPGFRRVGRGLIPTRTGSRKRLS